METIIVVIHVLMSVMETLWRVVPDGVTEIFFMMGLFVTGVVASFVNMLAGGGSMLVLGLMILFGVDPVVANATNRVGVLISTATGAAAYKSEKVTDIKQSLKLGLWTAPGGIAGAIFSVRISGDLYEKILAIVMILIVGSMFLPKRVQDNPQESGRRRWIYPAMILVGFYGGVVQVGVGILIYGVLRHLGNMSLMRINMHRVFVVLIYIIPSMGIFVWSGKINWIYAAILCVGNAIGSWITIKWTLKKGEKIIRIGLAVSVVLMSVKFILF
ncbi:MAG: sulfite exporter TauE/SafE family protein [Deltaproteobacteria bacterium]|nr:sulfite exporter TauE/SafE family protein [Deltaproteobacteria bacterium]